MKKYIVKYEDVELGTYTIFDEENAEYIVDEDAVLKLKDMGFDIIPMIRHSEKNRIAFFDNRIKNCSRFPGKKIGYHTDSVELVEVSE